MLLPCICVADVITTRLVLLPMKFVLADVIAMMVADVITTVYNVLADVIATATGNATCLKDLWREVQGTPKGPLSHI